MLRTARGSGTRGSLFQRNQRRSFRHPAKPAQVAVAPWMSCEVLEERRLLSTINWVNRGDATDQFDEVFGANDDAARAVVDAALDAWEQLIVDFNQAVLVLLPLPHIENPNTLDVTLDMALNTPGFGGGAGNPATYDLNGTPLSRGITINSGTDTDADGTGDGVGWYLDANPNDHSEYAGPIFNPFVGQATVGGAADNLNDLYSLVTIEMNHALGLTNFGSTPAWTGNPFLSPASVGADSVDTPGNLFTFSGGPSGVTALLTSNNGGPGGTNTAGPLHVALPPQTAAGIPAGFSGALDVGNASGTGFPGDLRFLPSLLSSLMLSDVYGYTLAAGGADVFGTMHALLNSTNGNVLVRGMTGTNNSNDVINISRSGSDLVVSVDVGADVAGTGPTGPLETRFNVGSVQSITINGLDGNDTINVSGDLSFLTGAVTVTGDGGDDTLTLDFGAGNLVPGAGLSFDGGNEPGSDLLVLEDGSFATETYNATGASSGNILLGGASTITYTNLAPIDDTLAVTNFTFNGSPSGDTVEIENSPNAGRSRIRSATGTFELLDYANKTNITVSGAGGSDTLNLTMTAPAPGQATLTVAGGTSSDTINVATTVVPTIVNGDDASDTININGTSSTLIANGNGGDDTVNVNDTGAGSTVVVNGNDGGDTLNLFDSGAGSALTVNGNNHADTVNVSGTGSGVTVNGGDGGDTLNVTGTGPGTSLTINGNADVDTVNVTGNGAGSSLTVNGDGGNDRINVTGAGLASGSTVQFNGNADDDTFDVTSSPLVTIPVDGGTGSYTLKVNGQTLTYLFDTLAGVTRFTTAGRQPVTSVLVELLDVRNGTFTVAGGTTVDPNVRVQGVEDGPATLNGTGTIAGTLRADSGGTVSPAVGAGVTGVLTSGSATLNAGSIFFVDLNGIIAGTDHDQLNVAPAAATVAINNATLAGTLGAGYVSIPGDELVIIHNGGSDAVVGKFLQGDIVEIGGKKFAIDYAFDGDNDGNLNDVALIRYGAELHPDPCDPTKTALFVSATTGADNVLALPETGSSRVNIVIEAVTQGFTDFFGPFDFDGQIIMMGQSGNDLVSTEAVPSRNVMLYGNVGNDRVVGGNNGGILLGNLGDDTLVGGNSRELMIGGQGADVLTGNAAGDILIGASTEYDTNTVAHRQALCDILHEWEHGGRRSGLLNVLSVFDDVEQDRLTGGLGTDWFIHDLNDILDQAKNELASDL